MDCADDMYLCRMATQRSVAFHTLGCKLNFSETSTISRSFEKAGYVVRNFEDTPDIFVINTCSVTDFADRKCREVVRRARRINDQGVVVMIGCYAQLQPGEIASISGVDLVLGAREKFNLVSHIDQFIQDDSMGAIHASEIEEVDTFQSSFSFGDRTRSFLKVQDGCDYSCSFCTIPQARGVSRSATIADVLAQAEEIKTSGIKEVVLTGVNIGDFGKNQDARNEQFLDLIVALDKVGLPRIRISSIEPNLCSNEIIDFVASSRSFMPHFHMPLQSGSDRILGMMRRRYKSKLYRDRVERIKAKMPHAAIGVDVITGFPGEGEKEFLETYHFINELDVAYLHVFTYSERANTPANEMQDVVPMVERRSRNKMLRTLSDKKKRVFYQQFMGSARPVLTETSKTEGHLSGFTDNYIKVSFEADDTEVNQLIDFALEEIDGNLCVRGRPLTNSANMVNLGLNYLP